LLRKVRQLPTPARNSPNSSQNCSVVTAWLRERLVKRWWQSMTGAGGRLNGPTAAAPSGRASGQGHKKCIVGPDHKFNSRSWYGIVWLLRGWASDHTLVSGIWYLVMYINPGRWKHAAAPKIAAMQHISAGGGMATRAVAPVDTTRRAVEASLLSWPPASPRCCCCCRSWLCCRSSSGSLRAKALSAAAAAGSAPGSTISTEPRPASNQAAYAGGVTSDACDTPLMKSPYSCKCISYCRPNSRVTWSIPAHTLKHRGRRLYYVG
jgi:hypothetical protein